MIVFPNAKINLGLNILGKRKDGYHDISTCFYPIPWKDILEIVPNRDKGVKIFVTGMKIPGGEDENLCVKAFRIMKKDFDIPGVSIHLHKQIPAGSGLGGGSSDAAFTITSLDRMFNLYLDEAILKWYALKIGSDCPFFIDNKAGLASGRGEVREDIKIDLSGKFILIVCPGFGISTSEAYRNMKPAVPDISIREIIEGKPMEEWKDYLINDFEKFVFTQHPELETLKKQLYDSGALYASMSGSGSAFFGIFHSQPETLPEFPAEYRLWEGVL